MMRHFVGELGTNVGVCGRDMMVMMEGERRRI